MMITMRLRVCFYCALIATHFNLCQSTFSKSDLDDEMVKNATNSGNDYHLNKKVSPVYFFDNSNKISYYEYITNIFV